MKANSEEILKHLDEVAAERLRRTREPVLAQRVQAIKAYQHARFAQTYADLMASPRYATATRFFLDDLYGPGDFTDRDAQFARVVPALVRLFPARVVGTVRSLSSLHALSEELDSAMGGVLMGTEVDALSYQRAWQSVDRKADRQRQIDLMIEIGQALEGFTRSRVLGHSLRLMREPARRAGLSSLQRFLETGFDAFKSMQGSSEFLHTIEVRERALAARLFGNEVGGLDAALPADSD